MKNAMILAVALFMTTISFTSCKKDYICKCSKTYTSGTGSSTSNHSIYTYSENRKRAEDRCNENSETGTDLMGDYSINCQIQ